MTHLHLDCGCVATVVASDDDTEALEVQTCAQHRSDLAAALRLAAQAYEALQDMGWL